MQPRTGSFPAPAADSRIAAVVSSLSVSYAFGIVAGHSGAAAARPGSPMNKKILGAVAAGVVAVGGVASAGSAQADTPSAKHFEHLSGVAVGTTFRPSIADPDRQVKVIVQLTGASVAATAA